MTNYNWLTQEQPENLEVSCAKCGHTDKPERLVELPTIGTYACRRCVSEVNGTTSRRNKSQVRGAGLPWKRLQ